MADDLNTLIPGDQLIKVCGGETIQVSPLLIRDIGPITRALKPIQEPLEAVIPNGINRESIFGLMEHSEALIKAVAIATGKTAAEIGVLELDDFILLALTVIEVNADFFTLRLLPIMRNHRKQADGLKSASD